MQQQKRESRLPAFVLDRTELRRIVFFGVVGGLTGLLWMVITYVAASRGLQPWLAAAFAFCCCVPIAYLGHRKFTFESNAPIKREIAKFAVKTCAGFIIATTFPELVVRAGGTLMLAILLTPVAVACVTYPVARLWVFDVK